MATGNAKYIEDKDWFLFIELFYQPSIAHEKYRSK